MDFLSKTDLIAAYSVPSTRSFEKLIGEEGRKALDWKKGKQFFTPKQIRNLYSLIGPPLSRAEKYA